MYVLWFIVSVGAALAQSIAIQVDYPGASGSPGVEDISLRLYSQHGVPNLRDTNRPMTGLDDESGNHPLYV